MLFRSTSTDRSSQAPIYLSVGLSVWVCLCVGVFVYLCIDLSMWMCLCVGVHLRKKKMRRGEVTEFVVHGEEREKNV